MQLTRRVVLTHLGAAGTLAALLKTGAAAEPKAVTQRELAEVIGLHNRAELLAASIRRRLESGAAFERGQLGVSTVNEESLQAYADNGIGAHDSVRGVAGLDICPADEITFLAELLASHPNIPGLTRC
jgi:hypothetical protein